MHVEIPDIKMASAFIKINCVFQTSLVNFKSCLMDKNNKANSLLDICLLSVVPKLVFLFKHISHSTRMLEAGATWPPDQTETNFMHS